MSIDGRDREAARRVNHARCVLKASGLAASGGAAVLIAEGGVLVNGERETRRGRTLRAGDVVALGERRVQVLHATGSLKLKTGTMMDATIIGALSSTKNADKARDPEMHQTREGQQYYFGVKLHISVEARADWRTAR